MKNEVKAVVSSIIVLAVAILLAVYSPSKLTGNTISDGYCVNAVVNDISPSSVGIDKEFTVGILIDNCGDALPENVVFELTKVSPDIQIKESLVQDIGKMGYANSQRFIVYHMRTSKNVIPGDYVFDYKLSYTGSLGSFEKENSFSVTVSSNRADLSMASVKTNPVLVKEGETAELTIRIENFGEGSANSLKIVANHPFEGVKEAFIGTLDSDEDGPAVFTFVAGEPGIYIIPVKITYQDDFGENTLNKEITLEVLSNDTNWFAILTSLVLIIIFGYVIYSLWNSNQKKEIVIKQLLGKKESRTKKSKK